MSGTGTNRRGIEGQVSMRKTWRQRLLSAFYGMVLGVLIPTLAAGQTATLLPDAKQQYFDDAGNPVASGSVTYYVPTTSTKKNVWLDATKATLSTNPVFLDAAGRPQPTGQTYGDGQYRQVVKDVNNIVIWDAVTSSGGGGGPSPTPTVGDGNLVGTVLPWSGLVAPPNYVFAYGQSVLRTDYPLLFTTLTQTVNLVCTSGLNVLSGIADTQNIKQGAAVEATCIAPGTQVNSISTNSVTISATAAVSTATTAIFFPWGNGNGSTTFNVPDFRGRALLGRNNMGGTAGSTLTSLFYGVTPNALGAAGGTTSNTLLTNNLPAYTPGGTITNGAITNVVTGGVNGGTSTSTAVSAAGVQLLTGSTPIVVVSSQATSSFAGTAQGGANTPFSNIPAAYTINYIVKVLPDASTVVASGVASLGGMTGILACGTGITCSANTVSVTPPVAPTSITYFPACDLTGVINCASSIQAQVDLAVSNGGGIVQLPCTTGAQTVLVNTSVTINNGGIRVKGCGYEEFAGYQGQTFPQRGTTGTYINTISTSVSPFVGGPGANGSVISDMAFVQPQPADTAGWTPTVFAPSIAHLGAPVAGTSVGRLEVERVLFAGVYAGIKSGTASTLGNSQFTGRDFYHNIEGTCFSYCIDTSASSDTQRVENLHIWPYFATQNSAQGTTPNIDAYLQANATGWLSSRNDNPMGANLFFYGVKNGIKIDAGNPDGSTAGVQVTNLDCDNVRECISISSAGSNQYTVSIVNMTHAGQTNGVSSGSYAVHTSSTSTGVKINVTNLNAFAYFGPAVFIEGTGNDFSLTNTSAFHYNQQSAGTNPLVSVATGNAGWLFGRFSVSDNNSSPGLGSTNVTDLTATARTGTGSTAVYAAGPTITNPIVTGSFTATGLVTNGDLTNPATTVNGQTCTLGAACTVTAAATSIAVGSTTVTGGTTTRVLFDNGAVLGEYSISGTGSVAMTNTPAFTTPDIGAATGVSFNRLAIAAVVGSATLTPVNGVNFQFPAASGTGATLANVETLTNKTISGASNTLTNIGNGSLTNPATTVNGQTCTLGSTCTVTAAATGITIGSTTVSSGTSHGVLTNNAGNLGNTVAGTNGQLLLGVTSAEPAFATMSGGASITNAGVVTILTNANLTGAITSAGNATSLGSFTSANLSGALTDETGSGLAVFGTGPILNTVDARGTWTTGTSWTLPAFTLGGVVSGGGNQINNVVIGNTSPLAGSFTTLSASTSVTSPLNIGGSAVGSSLSLQSTTGVGVGADSIKMLVGNNGATQIGTWTTTGLGVGTGATTPGNIVDIVQSQNGTLLLNLSNQNAGSSALAALELQTNAGAATFIAASTAGGAAFNWSWGGAGSTQFLAQNATGNFIWYTGASPTAKMSLSNAGILNVVNHITATSTAPTISSCGVSPSVSGSDNFGSVTAGTGILSSCVVNFGVTWGAAPRCVVSSSTAIASLTVSATTTQLTIGGTSLTGDAINWICGSTS